MISKHVDYIFQEAHMDWKIRRKEMSVMWVLGFPRLQVLLQSWCLVSFHSQAQVFGDGDAGRLTEFLYEKWGFTSSQINHRSLRTLLELYLFWLSLQTRRLTIDAAAFTLSIVWTPTVVPASPPAHLKRLMWGAPSPPHFTYMPPKEESTGTGIRYRFKSQAHSLLVFFPWILPLLFIILLWAQRG